MTNASGRRRRRNRFISAVGAVVLFAGACTTGDDGEMEAPSEAPTATTAPSEAPSATTTSLAVVTPDYLKAELPVPDRVEDLLARMTLAEKIGQMTLVEKNSITVSDLSEMSIGALLSGGGGSPQENSPAAWAQMVRAFQEEALASRLGIPLLYGIDAVHGHSNVKGAVIFPHNIGLGAANDPDLMERIGRITALEMLATNIHWNYAPAVSVPRDIRWGRTYEGYAEEPDLVTELSAAYQRGLQGDDLSDPTTVLATPKHFVGDGGTAWGSSTTNDYSIDQGVTDVDEETLRAIHLPPYIRAIEEGAASIMVSYSSWGGEKMHAQQYLVTDVLKGELGFGGFVVSDWAGIDQISDDYYESVVRSINAGVDVNMVPQAYGVFMSNLADAVAAGDVSEERIDDAVRRLLTVKFSLGLFENPFGDESLLDLVGSAEHRAVAREAVAKSQVLLKNEGGLLPLDPAIPKLYVAGRGADDVGLQSGGWTISWQGGAGPTTPGTTIMDAITATVAADTVVEYDGSGRFEIPDGESATCLGVVAEQPYAEGMGDDGDLQLSVSNQQLVTRLAEQCERLVVVMISGRPLIITEFIDQWDALVASWLPGTEGAGVVDVLFGAEPFTGTLPVTWPRSVDQLPVGQGSDQGPPLFERGAGLTG